MLQMISSDRGFYHIGEGTVSLCGVHGLGHKYAYDIEDIRYLVIYGMSEHVCDICITLAVDRLQEAPPAEETDTPLLGYKSIMWDPDRNVYCSPLQSRFIWPRSGYAEAECRYREFSVDGVPLTDHTPGAPGCVCGIYAVPEVMEAQSYFNVHSALVLVEGLGEVEVYSKGFRAEAAQIRAVVNKPNRMLWPLTHIALRDNSIPAAGYFDVDLIGFTEADQLIKQSWAANGLVY